MNQPHRRSLRTKSSEFIPSFFYAQKERSLLQRTLGHKKSAFGKGELLVRHSERRRIWNPDEKQKERSLLQRTLGHKKSAFGKGELLVRHSERRRIWNPDEKQKERSLLQRT